MPDIFITENFLLSCPEAIRLYHDFAAAQPIVDYHCHLPQGEIARDRRFANLTQIWLNGDHYKWRALRANGVDERYITGNATDREKFQKWAETVPMTLRNPLYHWTHLELKRPFGIGDRLLNPDSAESIWSDCAVLLARPEFSCRGIMRQMNVRLVCTTDDPVDSLADHHAIAADTSFPIRVLPTFRPDKGMAVENPAAFNAWVDKLAAAANVHIAHYDAYLAALNKRHDDFHASGGRLSDHGLETAYADDYTESEIKAIFAKIRAGNALDAGEISKFKSALLYEFGVMDHARNWTQQFHFGALRNTNSRLLGALGPDTGFDSIGDFEIGRPLGKFLNRLDRENKLARTILYNVNPRDNELFATMAGNFQDGTSAGKIQYGSAWWFTDQLDGMTRQIDALSNMGLLSRFVGMLTDSRSFLSYTRHEYFRRLLCNILGTEMQRGLLPCDFELIGGMVRNISYGNAAKYFGFDLNN
jgi:glucuronate isomerase